MKNRIILTLSLLAVLAVLIVGAVACSESKANPLPPETPVAMEIPAMLMRADGLGSVDEKIHMISLYDESVAQLRQDANNVAAKIQLAEIFMVEARVTGEHPYYYPAALTMLNSALETENLTQDDRFHLLNDLASVQLSLHDFAEALETGEEAVELFPYSAGIYGVLVDANVELGNYEAAVNYADQMVAIRPDLRSYARVSYLRELHGDVEGAIDAMEMAVAAGMPGFEETAWARLTLGNLYENYGQLDYAEMHYRIILEERENYPFATAALARIERKKGNLETAETYLESAIALIPEVGFWQEKAALKTLQGDTKTAAKLADESLEMMAEDAESGHNMDLEIARLYLDQKNDPEQALTYAMREYEIRPANIKVNAVLGRIYYAKGEYETAASHFEAALATGSKEPQLSCMAGLNKIKTGDEQAGTALIKASFEADPYQDHRYVETSKSWF